MSQQLGMPPPYSRSRSHTDPSKSSPSPTEPQTAGANLQPTRPSHVRSRSYLSPTETKPRNALTLPAASALERTAERLHRVHIPGSSHLHHHRSSQHQHSRSHSHARGSNASDVPYKGDHRPTQSDGLTHKTSFRRAQSKQSKDALPHLLAGLNAERDKRNHLQRINTNTNAHTHSNGSSTTTTGQSGSSLHPPLASQTSEHADRRNLDARLRETSEPYNRPQPRQKTSFEEALDRGDQARVARRIYVKKADIQRHDAEIAAAEDEMRTRIANMTAKGVEITRRLDYGYYNLLETINSLVATITSFQSLSDQTSQLIINFDKESERLDQDTSGRVERFKREFEVRNAKAEQLSARGKKVNERAEDLSLRLENARVVLKNWERKEDEMRKVWFRVGRVGWYLSLLVVISVLAFVVGKESLSRRGGVHGESTGDTRGAWNGSIDLPTVDVTLLSETPGVPDDVKRLIEGAAERNKARNHGSAPGAEDDGGTTMKIGKDAKVVNVDDPRFRVWDEL
ncbi:hypothetical protein PV08_00263 [Exophiala spinifera]|uniref:Uncharacterized protein n=1 Tax=Exophiala spinifera TaxID=91928 RepID=A0A0D2C7X9_9EURO|nr:uncharacterized protein PV08_00263 [Exophiala spinifera]KIW19689.1 hypothetical protein PV08_00263 [Exophiala spinifera]